MSEQIYVPVIEKRRGVVVANVGNVAVCDFPIKNGTGPEIIGISTSYIDRQDPMLEVSGRECVYGVVSLALREPDSNDTETAQDLLSASESATIN
jgi:hypothetical protein